jgi:general secretion pathway protein F
MATFVYRARTRGGESRDGTVEANDRMGALRQIEALGYLPVSVEEARAAVPDDAKQKQRVTVRHARMRMGRRDVLIFTTELSDLLASGMTLGNALNALTTHGTGKAGDTVIAALRDDIIRGSSLSEAMARHPKTFSDLYVSMIRAGEASGALHDVLGRLVVHYERMQDVREKVVSALVYPVIVLVMGAATLVFSMVYVVPKFKLVFEQMGQALPLPTQILIATSGWMVRYGWAMAITLALVGVLLNRAVKTPAGRLWWHRQLLRLPLIRGVVASGIYANLARTLGTLLNNGVPALPALGIAEKTVGNVVIARELNNARDRVTDGTTISGPLAAGKMFPRIMTDMLAVGEQTGDMPGALRHIARRYENELDRNLKIMTTALEPLLIVLVAIVVGFVAISILMAVFNLTNGLDV